MQKDSGLTFNKMWVDGGASKNNFLMQEQSDISGIPVVRPECVETTAKGAAYLAGLAVGYWKKTEEVKENNAVDYVFKPGISPERREKWVKGWKKAVHYSYDWAKDEA